MPSQRGLVIYMLTTSTWATLPWCGRTGCHQNPIKIFTINCSESPERLRCNWGRLYSVAGCEPYSVICDQNLHILDTQLVTSDLYKVNRLKYVQLPLINMCLLEWSHCHKSFAPRRFSLLTIPLLFISHINLIIRYMSTHPDYFSHLANDCIILSLTYFEQLFPTSRSKTMTEYQTGKRHGANSLGQRMFQCDTEVG